MINSARTLYKLGFAIHWIRPKSKMPVNSGWTTGPRTPWSKLKSEYKKGYNVGVRLGTPSQLPDGTYLAVIDCDMKSTEKHHLVEMENKLADLGIDLAPIVASGRGNGSRHIYVRTKEPLVPFRFGQSGDKVKVHMPSQAKVSRFEKENLTQSEIETGTRLKSAWEISLMGDNQQVVLPPSIHPDSEKPYRWEVEIGELEDLPLFEFKGAKGVKEKREVLNDFAAEEVDLVFSRLEPEVVDMIITGNNVSDQSAAMFTAAIAMQRAGFTDNQILSVLTDKDNFLGGATYEHTKVPSRKRAADWIFNYTLKKVKREFSAEMAFDEVADDAPLPDKVSTKKAKAQECEDLQLDDYRKQLDRTKEGLIKPTFRNIRIILSGEAGEGYLAHNSFSVEDIWQVDTPWGCEKGKVANDVDAIRVKNWLSNNFNLEPSKDRIEEVFMLTASQSSFHPVKEYLETLEWDGIERLPTWLTDYMGAEGPERYLEAVGVKTLVAMVKRIYEPGCKFDQVLILEGNQGIGKSSAAAILAGQWFSDTTINVGDKDAVVNMQGVWVYELGELSVLNRVDSAQLKEFISRSTDKIRLPYGKRSMQFPRQSIFIGTTNKQEYFKDETGNRRFWPVKVHSLDRDALVRDRDQLLAEAIERYNLGELTYLNDDGLVRLAMLQQGKRMETDVMVEVIEKYLQDFGKEVFLMSELLEHMSNTGNYRVDRQTQMRVGTSLVSLGFQKQLKRHEGKRGNFWSKNGVQRVVPKGIGWT